MSSDKTRNRIPAIAVAALIAMVVLALSFVYLGFPNRSAGPAQSIEKLNTAWATLPHSALLQIAEANGYFAEEGLEVTNTPVTHGKLAIELLLQGEVDLAMAAEVPFVLQVLAGQGLGIVANLASASSENAVVARRDRAITSPGDLRKKKIGVTFGTSGEYFLWAYLIRQKLAPESVTLIDLPPGRQVEELAKGTVDAIATFEPFVSSARSALDEAGVAFSESSVYTERYVAIGRSEFLRGRPRAIEKFVRALLKAERFNRSEPEKALRLVAARLKLDVEALRPIYSHFGYEVSLEQSQIITLEEEARWAMARGYARQGPVPNFLPHLYLDALLAVQPGRVTVAR